MRSWLVRTAALALTAGRPRGDMKRALLDINVLLAVHGAQEENLVVL